MKERTGLSSLRSRLIILVLIAAMPGLLLTLFVATRQRQLALQEVENQNLSILRLAALSQQQLIANTQALFGVSVLTNEIRQHNVEGCNALLDHILQTSTGYRGFAVSTLDGKSWCLTKNLRTSPSTATTTIDTVNINADLYRRALAAKGFVVGDFVIGNITKRPNLLFAQPVYDEQGEAIAMLTAGLDLDWLNKSIDDLQLPTGYVVDILDRDGTFLVRWPNPQDYVGKTYADNLITQSILREDHSGREFTGEMEGVDGVRRLYAFKQVAGRTEIDLFINVGIAPELAYAEINQVLRQNIAVLAILTLLALAGAWVLSDVIVLQPISSIGHTVKEISHGNLSARTNLRYGRDELSLMARDFDQMCADLQRHSDELTRLNSELEQRVDKRTDQLQKAFNKLRESREQLRDLSKQQRVLLEEEQTRISREVHDQIGQALTGLKMDLAMLQRQVDTNYLGLSPSIKDKIGTMVRLIDDTIQSVRAIARRLRPTILDDLGLGAAIEWQANDFQQRTGITCSTINHNVISELDRKVTTAAFRIIQEALTNVARHAQATEVFIELALANDVLNIQIHDNGKGIEAARLETLRSLGILGMRERARELGGIVKIENGDGKGVLVTALLPISLTQNQQIEIEIEIENGHLT